MIFDTTAVISEKETGQNSEGTLVTSGYADLYLNIPCQVQPDDGAIDYETSGVTTNLTRLIVFVSPDYNIKRGNRITVDSQDLVADIDYIITYGDHLELLCFEAVR